MSGVVDSGRQTLCNSSEACRTMQPAIPLLIIVMFCGSLLPAQTNQPSIVDVGYRAPSSPILAPGQVVTLFARGMPGVVRAVATSLPLPTSLGGISVIANSTFPGFPNTLPILRVEPYDTECMAAGPECEAVAITVQIPTEGTCPFSDLRCMYQMVELKIEANGVYGQVFSVNVDYRFAHVHVLTSDDTVIGSNVCLQGGCSRQYFVTHADGNLVSAGNPAHTGETIIFYAVGLGRTTPAVPSGEPAPFPQPRVTTSLVGTLSYLTNTGDVVYLSPIAPRLAELVTGYVGMYQLNFTLPDKLPEQIASCRNGSNTLLYAAWFCWIK
jgi:hypothetical protein